MHDLVDYITHFNWLDYAFLGAVVYSVLTGAWVGFLAECLTIAGLAAGTFVAGISYNGVGNLIGHFGVPKDARDWAGFVTVFAVFGIVFSALSIAARKLSRLMVVGWSNTVAGALLGLIAGGIICLFTLVAIAFFQINPQVDTLQHSKLAHSSSSLLDEYTILLPTSMHQVPGFSKVPVRPQ